MKILVYLYCAVVCSVLAACVHQSGKSSQISEENTILIDFDNEQPLQASAWFDTIEYIPLVTDDSFLVSGVNHLKLTDQKDIYFISDKSFFLFDGQTGKGKIKISKLGGGPEEYVSIFDSYIDMESRRIELLDNNGKKIVIYDLSGNYLRSIPLPFMSFMLTKTGSADYWFYNNNLMSDVSESKVVHYDADQMKIVEDYSPIDKHLSGYFFLEDEKNLIGHDNGLWYLSSPVDTVYHIEPGKGMKAAYILDLGKYKAPQEFYAANYQNIMEFVGASQKHDYVFEFPTLAANDNMMAVACIKGGRLFLTFRSFEGNKAGTFSSLHDDFNFDTSLPLKSKNMHFCMDNDFFYFTMTAEQLVDWQKEGGRGSQMQKLIECNKITDLSNPILVKCKLKTN